jgi:hypothetical protein
MAEDKCNLIWKRYYEGIGVVLKRGIDFGRPIILINVSPTQHLLIDFL